MTPAYWDGAYRTGRKIWGERPSEIARTIGLFFEKEKIPTDGKRMLEVGCGYGRDALYFADRWKIRVLGVDPSGQAIEMAQTGLSATHRRTVEFRQARFQDITDETFDLVYAANLYQVLSPEERNQFCLAAAGWLSPGGLLLLGTLSSRDPEHAGQGSDISKSLNSQAEPFPLHLSTREELEAGFRFLDIRGMYEHEFLEPRAEGEPHHHIAWILIGARKPDRNLTGG
jgi:cyclopropane fatty-acyl-phospholipid synthase-like methyltransferase